MSGAACCITGGWIGSDKGESRVSLVKKAAKSGAWLAAFRFATQIVSWMVTIVVARLLSPGDYGLMSLASILTGYVEIFSELGLGSAIVQRKEITDDEYSSNFWFSLMVGLGFAVLAFGLAYPTAWLFNEPGVVPITQTISVLFLVGALMVVPFNILMRNLQFKTIGIIQFCAAAISSLTMLWMAYNGFGVWTLIGGTIVLRVVTVVLVFAVSGWRPRFHFKWVEVRGFLRFGMNVAGARSLLYVLQKVDISIVGAMLGTHAVGLYSFAMQLASLPTDKIVSLVNQVSYPIFSRVQDEPERVKDLYLRTTGYLAIVVSPLFLAGAIWGDAIVRAVLGEQWLPIVFLFRALCVAQLLVSLTTVSSAVHRAVGRSHWVLYFYLASVIVMPPAVFAATRFGLDAVAIPWLTVYPLLAIAWTGITLRSLGISWLEQVKRTGVHILASAVVIGGVQLLFRGLAQVHLASSHPMTLIVQQVLVAAACYSAYLWIREKQALIDLWDIRKA